MHNQYTNPWTEEQIQQLTDLYRSDMSTKDIAAIFDRSIATIRTKACSLGLKRTRNPFDNLELRFWKQSEEIYLKDHYISIESIPTIAINLNRSKSSIKNKAQSMGLYTDSAKEKYRWSLTDESYLIINFKSMSVKTIAHNLGFSETKILKKAKLLKLDTSVKQTHPEEIIEKVLNSLNISYTKQVSFKLASRKRIVADFVINNKIIEAQGNYWHCNPLLYPQGPKDKIQQKGIDRDIFKKQWYSDNGYSLLEIWESDCEDYSLVVELVTKFIGQP